MQKQSNQSYLFIPLIPIAAYAIYFIFQSLTAPSGEIDVKQAIREDFNNHKESFSSCISYLKNNKSVWNNYEIHFHPGLGTKFHGFGRLDTTKITELEYRKQFIKLNTMVINEVADFTIDNSILNDIKTTGISKITVKKDSDVTCIKFLYKFRKYEPVDYNYFIYYSNKEKVDENIIIWKNKINDTIYSYAVKD